MRRTLRTLATAGLGLASGLALGCFGMAVHDRDRDIDRSPVVNTGAGATVIRPGQGPPPHPGNYHPREAGYGQHVTPQPGAAPGAAPPAPAPNPYGLPPSGVVAPGVMQPPPEYASRSGSTSGAPAEGAGIRMLGGAETEETRHVSVREEPRFLKYAALPFAIAAAPFKYALEKLGGEPEPGPPVPRIADQPRARQAPGPPAVDYDTTRLREMERELARRDPSTLPPSTRPPAPGAGSTIADELAALRRATRAASRPDLREQPTPAVAPQRPSPPIAEPRAEGQVDRDGDGRTDHWIERRGAAIARELFDENFDGRPDRTLVYDASGREVLAIEEDADHDGHVDSWTTLRAGRIVGRRVDGDGDGEVDSWSSYRDGVITRLERDADGDGFRDRVAIYADGRLVREERDEDADGRTDLVQHYDDGERLERVEEDADGDGRMDVVSYYEGGRLVRREVLDTSLLGQAPGPPERP